ncbi:MAG: NUDIX domain-containing protein [Candidatus Saccharimonadaceae bacterium]|nr:NUDIX domain-containing protein [Candidatus Saccharimonadaceae bacterium]
MSYEPDAHQAQMKILRHLLMTKDASFAELQKETDMTSDHFTFHIKKLVKSGFIIKEKDRYSLTIAGKEYSNRMDTDENVIERQPKISVVLIIENHKGQVLEQQRLKHPYYGYWGHPTGKVRWGETLAESAARELMEETGLSADMRVAGLFHKMDYDESTDILLEDKYFCVIHATNPKGNLIVDNEGHRNEWLSVEDVLKKDKKFESIDETVELVRKQDFFFVERKYKYPNKDY